MSIQYFMYCRKSSEGRSRQIASLDDQESALQSVVEQGHLQVVESFRESKSAKAPHKRPIFRSMVDRIMSGEANGILCWHVNRLARNQLESGELQWMLQDGIIQSIRTPEREYLPEDHALLFAVESSMATQYVKDLRREVMRGTREKALKGWYPRKAKAGYIVDSISKEVLPDPERFVLLRQAWERFLTGAYSVPQVLDFLTSSGYLLPRTKSGGNKPMSRSSLYRLLVDPFYAGRFTFEGVERVGNHKPLVTEAEFQQTLQLLGAPSHGKYEKHDHPFTGFIRCGTCGCLITAETHVKRYASTGHSRSYTYYHCTGRRGCPKTSVDAKTLENMILSMLDGCRLNPDFVEWAESVLDREENEQRKRASVTAPAQERSSELLTKRLDRLFQMREDNEITAEEFQRRKTRHERDMQTIKIQMRVELERPERERTSIRKALHFRRDAYDRFASGGYEEKRTTALSFSGGYVLTLGNLTAIPKPGLDQLRTFELQKSRSQQIGSDDSGPSSPIWRAMLDELRKTVIHAMTSSANDSQDEPLAA